MRIAVAVLLVTDIRPSLCFLQTFTCSTVTPRRLRGEGRHDDPQAVLNESTIGSRQIPDPKHRHLRRMFVRISVLFIFFPSKWTYPSPIHRLAAQLTGWPVILQLIVSDFCIVEDQITWSGGRYAVVGHERSARFISRPAQLLCGDHQFQRFL